MNFRIVSILLILMLVVGCTPAPRYRSGGYEKTAQPSRKPTGKTTNDNIRLGNIMQKYLGKPYAGKSKYEPGVDCSSFTQRVFKEYDGTRLPRTVSEQYRTGHEVTRGHMSYGDLVFFRTNASTVSHVGIYIGANQFIHAATSRGVTIDNLNEKYWAKRFVSTRRILEQN